MLARLRRGSLVEMYESAPRHRFRAIRTANRQALVRELRRRAMATHHAARQRVRNGFDMGQLEGMAEFIRARPEEGTVIIRTRHRWDGGFAVDGSAEELENAGEGPVSRPP